MTTTKECPQCFNKGIYEAANGPDDYSAEYCQCPAGIKLEEENEKQEKNGEGVETRESKLAAELA